MEKKFFFIELKHKLFFSKRWQKRDKNSLILSGNSIGKMKVVYAIKNILKEKYYSDQTLQRIFLAFLIVHVEYSWIINSVLRRSIQQVILLGVIKQFSLLLLYFKFDQSWLFFVNLWIFVGNGYYDSMINVASILDENSNQRLLRWLRKHSTFQAIKISRTKLQ